MMPLLGGVVGNILDFLLSFFCVRYGISSSDGKHTVDGRNPKQPPGMYKTLQIM